MRDRFLIIVSFVASLLFFALALYGYLANQFGGNELDARPGFLLGSFLFFTNALAFLFKKKSLFLIAMIAPVWGGYLSAFIHEIFKHCCQLSGTRLLNIVNPLSIVYSLAMFILTPVLYLSSLNEDFWLIPILVIYILL